MPSPLLPRSLLRVHHFNPLGRPPVPVAVSYTNLDVYKRQVVDVVVLGAGAREPQAHGLDGAALAGGAALGGRGGVPALPADARDVGVDLDARAV